MPAKLSEPKDRTHAARLQMTGPRQFLEYDFRLRIVVNCNRLRQIFGYLIVSSLLEKTAQQRKALRSVGATKPIVRQVLVITLPIEVIDLRAHRQIFLPAGVCR